MISNLSLSAFSATNLRPTEPRTPTAPPPRDAAAVRPSPDVDRVRAQAETRPAEGLQALGRGAPQPAPGKPVPRGSLLDLSV